MVKIISFIIKSYQKLSRFFPRTCRFYPTCSHYALEALEKHGLWKGIQAVLWRFLRCSPFSVGGYDPVR